MASNPLEDDAKRTARIRVRAYHLWQADGEPSGRDAEYWERARELVGMAESAGAGQISPEKAAAHRINGKIVDEAALQENLGEFPGRQSDQGEYAQTPSKRAKPAPAPPPPAKPVKAKPSKTAPPAKIAEPVKAAKPAKTPEPMKPPKAAEPLKPAKAAKKAEPVSAAKPAKTEPAKTKPAKTKPIEPAKPGKTGKPKKS